MLDRNNKTFKREGAADVRFAPGGKMPSYATGYQFIYYSISHILHRNHFLTYNLKIEQDDSFCIIDIFVLILYLNSFPAIRKLKD